MAYSGKADRESDIDGSILRRGGFEALELTETATMKERKKEIEPRVLRLGTIRSNWFQNLSRRLGSINRWQLPSR